MSTVTYEQEVKRTAHRRASQILFRAWLFKIARNVVRRRNDSRASGEGFYKRPTDSYEPASAMGLESPEWLAHLDSLERDAVTLRFIEQSEPQQHRRGSAVNRFGVVLLAGALLLGSTGASAADVAEAQHRFAEKWTQVGDRGFTPPRPYTWNYDQTAIWQAKSRWAQPVAAEKAGIRLQDFSLFRKVLPLKAIASLPPTEYRVSSTWSLPSCHLVACPRFSPCK